MAAGDVVISEIYANGAANGTYSSDYVVLYNKTNQSIDLSGYSLQISGGAANALWTNTTLNGSIAANGFYLIRYFTASGGTPLPSSGNVSSTAGLGISGGRVVLTSTQSAVSGADPRVGRSDIVDYVGYGNSVSWEGDAAAPSPGTLALSRKNNGTADTDDNLDDFERLSPNPRSASSAPVVCYGSGTRIRTTCGDVPVERLSSDYVVVTASGQPRPIKWVGHRTMACRGRKDVLPVRIAAGAFGDGRPARDLHVSPAHALCIDVLGEVLIPACRLINGTTIAQVEREAASYWHIELESHDILLAEGLPAESYLDCGNRRFFANAETTDLAAIPDARPEGSLPFCRPFLEAGPLVELVRARLQDRAEALGWRKVEEAFAGLHLVADGRTIRPDVEGLAARFVLSADARDVRLVSHTSVPAHVVPGSTDERRLGLPLAALTIDDGLTGARAVALDDPRLDDGFHALDGGIRWTDRSATLPAELWAGCRGTMFLGVILSGPALPRWIAPGEAAGALDGDRASARRT